MSRTGSLHRTLLAGLVAFARPATVHARADCPDPVSASVADSTRARAALSRRRMAAARLRGTVPRIDGRLDDGAWCNAEIVTDFIQRDPDPGALATLPSSARVLFDDDAVYVAMRLSDPHPDSIVAPYPRRDDETTSDWAFVEIDSRFDHRTGFSFGVNPRGVQADGAWSNDTDYDEGWNGVWEGAATIDSGGWSAEFRIPYSQFALAHGREGQAMTWGINFYRYVARRAEDSNWAPRLPSAIGVVSHFNELHGLEVPPRSAGLEVLPYGAYAATRTPSAVPVGPGEGAAWKLGGDLRFRPTTTSTAAVSIRPDFGQVEADPAVVNLTTFETFLPEQRPMFVEGSEVFRFNESLDFASRGTSFAEESPFYSRRIGDAPHGACPAGALSCDTPVATEVLAAARVSGRTASGWSGGLFQAWTGEADVRYADSTGRPRRRQAEPLTRFTVLRAVRRSTDARAALGTMATFVDRPGMSSSMDSALAQHALVGGVEGRLRFAHDAFELSAFGLASRVDGSASAIGALRREPRHSYGRAASDAPGTAARTSLTGATAQARLARIAGDLQWGLAGRMVTRGFEANDVGFQRNADWLLAELTWQYQHFSSSGLLRRWSVGSQQAGVGWTTAGKRRAAIGNLTVGGDLHNFWGGSLSLDHEFAAYDPEVLRGGPALLLPPRERATLTLNSDTRRRWELDASVGGEWEPATRSSRFDVEPSLTAFVSDRLQVGVAPSFGVAREAWQYVGQAADAGGSVHYIVGSLRQATAALTLRSTYAFSSHLTLQWYSQLHLSGGRYTGFAEVSAPSAPAPEDRVTTIAAGRLSTDSTSGLIIADRGAPGSFAFDDPGFSERDLRVNFLMRWEFAPGSTLFLVWSHTRARPGASDFRIGRDVSRLWHAPGTNTLALKASYWIGF